MIKGYVIYIPSSTRSVEVSKECLRVAKDVGKIDVELWEGVDKHNSWNSMLEMGLKILPVGGSFVTMGYIDSEIGAFLSHLSLWKHCVEINERIMILEHDAMFQREYEDIEYDGILNLGVPNWGTKKWKGNGVKERVDCKEYHHAHDVYNKKHCQCDSKWLFGAHTYTITPRCAKILIDDAETNGIFATDIFIRTELVNIADQLPHNTIQESDFTLIQKTHRTELISANEAWN
tara:strand:+ start:970 stop:1668 length:699 start_codon:yes stop_codon:yes gene_type:complete